MNKLSEFGRRVAMLFGRRKFDREMEEEMRVHVEFREREHARNGLSTAEAHLAARKNFGNTLALREASHDSWGWAWLEHLTQDLRFALRMLRKSPGFTAIAVLTLALGIGANTAIFSVVNSVLLKPLPYPDSGRIVCVFLNDRSLGITRGNLGDADFLALQKEQQSFSAVTALKSPDNGFALTGTGDAVEIPGSTVTAGFFSVLGEQPMLGRAFSAKDGEPGAPETVVVSYQFWQEHLQGNAAAIGRSITLDEKSYSVIGVMPKDFHFGFQGVRDQLWPILQVQDIHQRPPYFLFVLARLKAGVSVATASADEARIANDVRREYGSSGTGDGYVLPFKDFLSGIAGPALWILLGAVGFVLLIAVVNVANLQIARATARQREMAIRTALGAGRMRLARQLLTECILLGAIGAAIALAIVYRLDALLALSPVQLPRMNEVAVDGRVLIFTVAVALVASILFGLVPILGMRTRDLDESLKQGGRSDTGSTGSRVAHRVLVISEFSLALVLLAGAGLLLRSLSRLEAVSPGFEPVHVITTQINLPAQRYAKAEQVSAFYQQLVERVSNTPGVQAAGLTMSAPPNLLEVMNPFHVEGQPYTPGKASALAEEVPVSEDYLRTLGVPLVGGRFFNEQDRLPSEHVLLINRTMAQNYFPGRSAVGQRVQTGDADPKGTWYTIVGVVGDVKYEGLVAKNAPTMYVPIYDDGWNPWFTRSMFLVVRTSGRPSGIASSLHAAVEQLDRDVPIAQILTMEDLLSQSVDQPRFFTVLLGAFAVLALVLAAVGIYGVMSYTVTRRTHEIGIMMALGAQRKDVLKLVLGQGVRLALIGTAIGMAAAFVVTRLMSSLLYGTSPTDPATFVGVATLLAIVAMLACYLPARRAMRVDPMIALRHE